MSVLSENLTAQKNSAVCLRPGALSLLETIGQSLAAVGPTLTPAINIAVVAGLAGTGSWLAYFIGTIGVIIVAACVGILAVRHPEAGSYFVYIGRNFGPLTGALAGWAMISAYLFTALAVALSFPIFLGNLLASCGVKMTVTSLTVAMMAFLAVVLYAAYRDVKVSSRVGLVLELVSVTIIVGMTVLIASIKGTVVDPIQLDIGSFKQSAVFSALPFVIFSFVGFESAATMAKESSNPQRDIPRAVIGCAAACGLFFTVIAYFMMFGSGDDAAALGASGAPFQDVATKTGLGKAAIVVYLAALTSVFACVLASINAAARLLYSMGKYKFLHRSMGLVHDTHQTPHRAVLWCGGLLALACLVMAPLGFLDAFGYAGTFASFGFVVVYLGICLAAPIDLKKRGEMRGYHVLIGAVGTALMLFVIFGSVYPVPPFPYDILPYLFFAYMLVGTIWFSVLKLRSPAILQSIEHDMEG